MNKIFIDYLEDKKKLEKPLWIMRQAGRYLPEYMEIRKNFRNFLDFCYSPEAVCEVTLQPIRRFDFDAAIIFSDILVIPHLIGQKIDFTEGPVLEELNSEQVFNLKFLEFDEKIEKIYEAIALTRANLPKNKALIGFAGAPWTLACYMLGKSYNEFKQVKILAYEESKVLDFLIESLTESIKIHLLNQIKAGVDVIQIFDSWAGILSDNLYDKYVIEPTKNIVNFIKEKYNNIKIIGFARNSGVKYLDYLQTNIDVIGLDQYIDLDWAIKNLSDKIILQGNFDPLILLSKDEEKLRKNIYQYLQKIKDKRVICNLGHGILKETPVENVKIFRDIIKNYE